MEDRLLSCFVKRLVMGVGPDGTCWTLTGSHCDGYKLLGNSRHGMTQRAHRHSYEHFIGAIPDGLVIDHLCRNRGCVNPRHLEPVTIAENIRRGETVTARNSAKTHCPHGHSLTDAYISIHPNGKPYRNCRVCPSLRQKAKRAANKDDRMTATIYARDPVDAAKVEKLAGMEQR